MQELTFLVWGLAKSLSNNVNQNDNYELKKLYKIIFA